MIITRNYRLEEQGGIFFRADKRNGKVPDMRGKTDSARRAGASDKRNGRKKNEAENTAIEVRKMREDTSRTAGLRNTVQKI